MSTQWFEERLEKIEREGDYDEMRKLAQTMSDWAEGLATCIWQLTDHPDDPEIRTKCKRYFESYVLNEDVNLVETTAQPKQPEDHHTENAARMFEVLPHNVTPHQRRVAKAAVFGLGGEDFTDPKLLRTEEGYINNCSLANGAPEEHCQICKGDCPDREKF